MRPAVAAIAVLALAASATAAPARGAPAATGFDYARYVPTSLAQAEQPADGTCTSAYRPGQPVHLYVTRFGCVLPVDRSADRAILSINEFQVEPIGPPEPAQ